MTDRAPRRRGVLVALAALLSVLALVVVALVQAPKAPQDGARRTVLSYLDDLKQGRYEDAARLLCPGLSSEQAVKSDYERDTKQLGDLKTTAVTGTKSVRSFRLAWPPTEAHVSVSYLMAYDKGPRLRAAEVRDTSAGLRICAFTTSL